MADTACVCLGSVQIGPEAPQEHLKRHEGTSGASKIVWGNLKNIRKGPGVPQERQKRPTGA